MSSTEPPGWANPGPGYGPAPSYDVIPGAPARPWPGVPAPAPAPGGRGSGTTVLAIVAIAVSGVALLAAVLAMITVGRSYVSAGLGAGDYSDVYSLPGQLGTRSGGSAASAAELQRSLTQVLEDDGSEVESITCPATPRVAQGVVTPCHADMDDDDWSVVVIFEDSSGRYTALVS